MISDARKAIAMMVICGLTPNAVGMALAVDDEELFGLVRFEVGTEDATRRRIGAQAAGAEGVVRRHVERTRLAGGMLRRRSTSAAVESSPRPEGTIGKTRLAPAAEEIDRRASPSPVSCAAASTSFTL